MARRDPKGIPEDLTKALLTLTEKVTDQAVLIEAQNEKLREQQRLLEGNMRVVEELKITLSSLRALMCEQPTCAVGTSKTDSSRSVSSESSTTVSAPVQAPARERKPVPAHEPAVQGTSTRARRAAVRASKTATILSTSKNKTDTSLNSGTATHLSAVSVGPHKPHPANPTNTDASTKSDNEWKEVSYTKRKPKRPSVVAGTGSIVEGLQTVEKLKFIQAWSFHPDTSEEQVRKHINNIEKSKDYLVEKRQIKTDRHASFIIGMPESLHSRLSSASSWPHGVRFADWFRFRPRGERGAPQPAAVSQSAVTGAPRS